MVANGIQKYIYEVSIVKWADQMREFKKKIRKFYVVTLVAALYNENTIYEANDGHKREINYTRSTIKLNLT